jgi:elongation factor P
MKITTSDVKIGTILNLDGKLCKVTEMSHTHMGRGGATDSYKVKDIVTGKTFVHTVNAGTVMEAEEVNQNRAMFLYKNGDTYSFMETDSGEMHDLNQDLVDDVADYLKENLEVYLMIHNSNVLGVILPATIEYTITETVPGIKGDRAQAGKKPATLETGMEVMVPIHKEVGQVVVVNTLTGDAA